MGFTSKLVSNVITINDDASTHIHLEPPTRDLWKGLELHRRTTGFGAIAGAPPFPAELMIPSSEFQARIQEKEAREANVADWIKMKGMKCKNQQSTNFCWGNAPTKCTEIVIGMANDDDVDLSPASVCCPINGFRNEGGWGESALLQIVNAGAVPTKLWPANAISQQYYTEEAKRAALNYRVTEWWELVPHNIDQLISLLLRGYVAALGLNWWSHEVTALQAIWKDGAIAALCMNSWGQDWPNAGANGLFILQGSKLSPDDVVAPRLVMAA